jgi:hypothetical protein
VPADCSLSYLDEDKDEICLNSDEDLSNMFNAKLKTYKVYIKQSFSQSIVVDVDRSQSIDILDNFMAGSEKFSESVELPAVNVFEEAFKK